MPWDAQQGLSQCWESERMAKSGLGSGVSWGHGHPGSATAGGDVPSVPLAAPKAAWESAAKRRLSESRLWLCPVFIFEALQRLLMVLIEMFVRFVGNFSFCFQFGRGTE